ncbi:hypothetical protein E4H12_01500 [Candidatus Thorarchaeota archaeon]|nr:MAG: hypothetical protein E4H12_01500 [Candidatus Thorarchaeota archaeon]
MTEGTKTKIGITAEMGGFAFGLALIIWSINLAILAGTVTTGIYQPALAGALLLPPLGSYFVITSAVDILRVIRTEEH